MKKNFQDSILYIVFFYKSKVVNIPEIEQAIRRHVKLKNFNVFFVFFIWLVKEKCNLSKSTEIPLNAKKNHQS